MIRMSSQLETNLVSVERVKEYSSTKTEVGNVNVITTLVKIGNRSRTLDLVGVEESVRCHFLPISPTVLALRHFDYFFSAFVSDWIIRDELMRNGNFAYYSVGLIC